MFWQQLKLSEWPHCGWATTADPNSAPSDPSAQQTQVEGIKREKAKLHRCRTTSEKSSLNVREQNNAESPGRGKGEPFPAEPALLKQLPFYQLYPI